MGDTLCPELLSSQVWRWPRVLPRAVLFLYAPAFYCSDCFLVTCLATSFLFIKRNKSDLSNLHWPRRKGWRLNSFRANGHQDGAWGRRDTPGNFLEGQEGLGGKLIRASHSESQRCERHGSPLPPLFYCTVGDGAGSGVLSCTSFPRTPALPLSEWKGRNLTLIDYSGCVGRHTSIFSLELICRALHGGNTLRIPALELLRQKNKCEASPGYISTTQISFADEKP